MKFGKLSEPELDSTPFPLSPDAERTIKMLFLKAKSATAVYVGCAKWGRKDWVGGIYPKKQRSRFPGSLCNPFQQHNLHTSDYTRTDEWVLRIKNWMDNGLEELYFFMHQPDEKFTPELALYAQEKLGR